jgi:hypothetical protein
VAAGLFLISLPYPTLCIDRTAGVYDEGIILFGADRVPNGAVPHRASLYEPAQFPNHRSAATNGAGYFAELESLGARRGFPDLVHERSPS